MINRPYVRVVWKQTEQHPREYSSRFDDLTRAAAYVNALRTCGFWLQSCVVVEPHE